jgi:hypothetical protein
MRRMCYQFVAAYAEYANKCTTNAKCATNLLLYAPHGITNHYNFDEFLAYWSHSLKIFLRTRRIH